MTIDERTAVFENEAAKETMAPLARITLLYESRDGRFCLFEDAEGHLAAVDASKLV